MSLPESSSERPQYLILLTGLPGIGKSTMAEAIGRDWHMPVFSIDRLTEAVWRAGVPRDQPLSNGRPAGYIGYILLDALAEHQLQLGQSAILDCVAGEAATRARWRAFALRYGALFALIECVCSDNDLHRQRVEYRQTQSSGVVAWEDVERVRGTYQSCQDEPRLVLDTAQHDDHLNIIRTYLEDLSKIQPS